MDSKLKKLKPQPIHLVFETDSKEFNLLTWALNHSSVIGFDAEWKPIRTRPPPSPTVSLLQIACRVNENSVENTDSQNDMLVFVVDILSISLSSIWELLRDVFISPNILKLGFQFKQDLTYLSSTFCSQGCDPGFDRVEPYLDILGIYNHLQQKEYGGNFSNETKGLSLICEEVLGVFLSKELQCSNWSHRPLTEDQKKYAAADAQCLLEIFTVFQANLKEDYSYQDITESQLPNTVLGSKDILVSPGASDSRVKFCQAPDIISSTTISEIAVTPIPKASCINAVPLNVSLSEIVRKYSERILLKEWVRKPKTFKEYGKRHSSKKGVKKCSNRERPPPLDLSLGDDGCPEDKTKKLKPQEIHLVSETDSKEFNLLRWALSCSSVIGLDAEWKRIKQPPLPTVSLLQIACRVNSDLLEYTDSQNYMFVFLIDLLKIRLSSIQELLREMFISPDILKLGFLFQQDLVYLSSTFCSYGCNLEFDLVEPYLDISSIYHRLQQEESGGKLSKNTEGLGAICKELLGVFHPKDLRFSNWSHRPLTEDQKTFAAANAQCLLEIFIVFKGKILKEGYSSQVITGSQPVNTLLGSTDILVNPDASDLKLKISQSSDIIRSATVSDTAVPPISIASCINTVPFSVSLSEIVRKYGERILLKEWVRKPKNSKKKEKGQSSLGLEKGQSSVGLVYEAKQVENCTHGLGPPPLDLSLGDDQCPKDQKKKLKPQEIHLVSETDSEEFNLLRWALSCSSVIGLDAEWKRIKQPPLPTVSLLQIACCVKSTLLEYTDSQNDMFVFLIDILKIRLSSIQELLRDMFISPDILKLGFFFQQDLVYLSSTFCSHGCNPKFDLVEPYLDISSIYYHLQQEESGGKLSKDTEGLGAICKEVLGVFHSKDLRLSDWSLRPLTEDQKTFAAAEVQCLLEIFIVFKGKILKEGYSSQVITGSQPANTLLGSTDIRVDASDLKLKFTQSSDIIRSATVSETALPPISMASCINTVPFSVSFSEIVRKYSERILLKEWVRKRKNSKEKENGQSSVGLEKGQSSVGLEKGQSSVGLVYEAKQVENCTHWQGPPPWDMSLGGDGYPKFLCDVTVRDLAKHLRCVGIDAAIRYSKRPNSRELINQARKEMRVLLILDSKSLRLDNLKRNQVYRVKSLLKNDQLLEVVETFKLTISKDQLMSRCSKCNGRISQKPLTFEEAREAAKGFQVIPNYLFNQNLEFWQCGDCKHFYWQGPLYRSPIQHFINVVKLND